MQILKNPFGKHVLAAPSDTRNLGVSLVQTLRGGEVILAYARMGVGKTCLAQGIAKGLGVDRVVNSPTFNMIKVYRGRPLTFYHVDAYRLEDAKENRDIGLWDILNDKDGVVYVEWPEYIVNDLKGVKNVIVVNLKLRRDGKREAVVKHGKL